MKEAGREGTHKPELSSSRRPVCPTMLFTMGSDQSAVISVAQASKMLADWSSSLVPASPCWPRSLRKASFQPAAERTAKSAELATTTWLSSSGREMHIRSSSSACLRGARHKARRRCSSVTGICEGSLATWRIVSTTIFIIVSRLKRMIARHVRASARRAFGA